MRWFGEHWGAPICDEADRADVPVGRPCLGCSQSITPGTDGLLIPLVADTVTEEPWHLDCFLRNVGIEPGGTRDSS